MSDFTSSIITSTGMMEQCPGLYAAVIHGRNFQLEYVPENNTLVLSMGASNLNREHQASLDRTLSASVHPVRNGPIFSDHYVSFSIPVESDWAGPLKRTIETLSKWADENAIRSGCFLCGSVDPSVYMHAVSNQNTYICEACETLLLEKEASSNREPEVPVESGFAHENWRKYLLRIIFFRALPSGLWITIFAKILNEVLPLTTDSGARELEADTMASSLVIFLITSFIFYIYYKATDEISVPGVLITSVVCTVITVLEGILAFSVSRVNLLVSEGQESVSILNVFAHFPDYFNEPITGTIGLYIFWFPLLGLGLSTLMAVIKTKSDYSGIYP